MYTIIFSFFHQQKFAIPYQEKYAEWPVKTPIIFKNKENEEDGGLIYSVKRKAPLGEEDPSIEIIRAATEEDQKKLTSRKEDEDSAKKQAIEKTAVYNLAMQILSAKYSFDDKRLEFCFTAPERVDFRELVKDLARTFKRKIRLRQIGPRDKAQIVGGCGVCGRKICCKTYMESIPAVTMEAAREQNIAHKSTDKLSGICGKLLCCLNYETKLYKEMKKEFPPIGSTVKIEGKSGRIVAFDVINNKVRVQFSEDETKIFSREEIKV